MELSTQALCALGLTSTEAAQFHLHIHGQPQPTRVPQCVSCCPNKNTMYSGAWNHLDPLYRPTSLSMSYSSFPVTMDQLGLLQASKLLYHTVGYNRTISSEIRTPSKFVLPGVLSFSPVVPFSFLAIFIPS